MPDGYFMTPNSQVPLNDREPGTIADVAVQQLKPFRDVASSWPIWIDGRCHRCRHCDQNIWFEYDNTGRQYKYSYDEILALIVAHIRQIHEELVTSGNV